MYPMNFPMLTLAALLLTNAAHADTASPQATPVNKPHAEAIIEERSKEKTFDENDSKYHCDQELENSVMISRTHEGDENDETTAQCASFKQNNKTFKYEKAEAEVFEFSQSEYPNKGWFECPDNKIVVGREHDGDENGKTRYYCRGMLGIFNETILPQDRTWSEEEDESKFDVKCKEHEVLTGFYHKGDENGRSRVQCASLY